MTRSYNAVLKYTTTSTKSLGIWVMKYEQAHALSGSSAQSKWFKHFYPRSYAAGVMQISGRVPTQYHYNLLSEFIRSHQESMISTSGAINTSQVKQSPLLQLSLPSENIYVQGWVESFQAGAKRFNPAPEFTLSFTVIRDAHTSDLELTPSHATRKWWSGKTIEGVGKIVDYFPVSATESEGNAYTDEGYDSHGLLH